MTTVFSLPFASLNSLQVVVRLGNSINDLSLSLEPLPPTFPPSSVSYGDNSFSAPNKMHFQLCHDDQGTLLRVFAMGDMERSPPQYDLPSLINGEMPASTSLLQPTIPTSHISSKDASLDNDDRANLDCDAYYPNYGTTCGGFPEPHLSEHSHIGLVDTHNLFHELDFDSMRTFNDPIVANLMSSCLPDHSGQDENRHRDGAILSPLVSTASSPTFTSASSSSSFTPALTPSSSLSASPLFESLSLHTPPHMMPMEDDPPRPAGARRACKRRKFSCTFAGCNRRFTSNYTLRLHRDAHKPKERLWFPCTAGCSEQFSRQHDRLRHEVARHGKVCEWICSGCQRFFSTSRTLASHKCTNSTQKPPE